MSSIFADYEVSELQSDVYEPSAKKRKLGPPLVVFLDGFAAIDFLNTDRQVFQVTIGSDHDMKGWVDLLLDANILSNNMEGVLEISANATPLDFYWVVPQHKNGWMGRKPKIPTKHDIPTHYWKQKSVIDLAIQRYVRQFVLFIEEEQPQQSKF